MLPEQLPEIAGVELAAAHLPAGEGGDPGGDWYAALELPGGDVGIAIGDVVGRGDDAVARGAQVCAAVRDLALEGNGPAVILERLNEAVGDLRQEMTTVVYAVFRPGTGELRGANAGHPPALLRRAGGTVERWDAARSVPLGVTDDGQYGEDAVHLGPGDVALLFTDGLVERREPSLDEALARLEAAVPAVGPAHFVRTAVLEAMLGAGDHDDDVALLALGVPADPGPG